MSVLDVSDFIAGSHQEVEFEIAIVPVKGGYVARGHVEGKRFETGIHATAELADHAGNEALAGLVMELLYAS